jgi:hypothetical protein
MIGVDRSGGWCAGLFGARRRLPDRLPWPLAFMAIAAMAILAWAVLLLGWRLLK